MADNKSEIILYRTNDGRSRISVRLEGGTVWLTQAQMTELFQVSKPNISMHIRNIFREGELQEVSVVKEYLTTAADGKTYRTRYYNLDVIIAVGYRVKSHRGTQFRVWATETLREYLVKGFALDDDRLKNDTTPAHYFDELLARIRDIRSAERRMYLQVRNILSLAADYEPSDEETQVFFQTVQNKLHFAATGKTAPELIAERADCTQPNMGLTVWKSEIVRKSDVTVAKNYLHKDEIVELNRIVTMFLDFAEDQARRRHQIFLRDWRERLDDFLHFTQREILDDAGTVSREDADRIAHEHYNRFHERRLMQIEDQAAENTLHDLQEAASAENEHFLEIQREAKRIEEIHGNGDR